MTSPSLPRQQHSPSHVPFLSCLLYFGSFGLERVLLLRTANAEGEFFGATKLNMVLSSMEMAAHAVRL